MEFILFGIMGLVSGLIGGLFGLGGGVLVVPLLLTAGFDVKVAVAISVVQMIFVSVFGSFLNFKHKMLDLKWGVFLGIGGIIGGSLSPFVLNLLSPFALSLMFFCFNVFAFYKFLRPKKVIKAQEKDKKDVLGIALLLIVTGVIVGVFASTLGIGGGLLMAPILVRFLGIDTRRIAAISLLFIVFSSSSATFSYFQHGILSDDILKYGSIIGIFSIFGVALGTNFLSRVTPKLHRFAFGSVYVISLVMTAIHINEQI
ncbi:MAG: sulfite exporter TauE/SafE family protein [Helicobacter sp.]|nr:sulfite exporter TauE/SafE family protein [Helicobacter sp.]